MWGEDLAGSSSYPVAVFTNLMGMDRECGARTKLAQFHIQWRYLLILRGWIVNKERGLRWLKFISSGGNY